MIYCIFYLASISTSLSEKIKWRVIDLNRKGGNYCILFIIKTISLF